MAIGDFVKKARGALRGKEDKASAAVGKVAGVVKRRTGPARDRQVDQAVQSAQDFLTAEKQRGAVTTAPDTGTRTADADTARPEAGTTAGTQTREPRPSYPVGGTFAPRSRAARPHHAPEGEPTGTTGREATP